MTRWRGLCHALPVEFCSIGSKNLTPFGPSVPTGSFGALWAPWGPCGPLRGPLMTMWRDLCHSPLNFGRMYSIWAPSVHQFRRAPLGPCGPHGGPAGPFGAPSGPSDDDVTWPMSLPVEFCSIGFNLNPFGPSVPTGSFGALWAPSGPGGGAQCACYIGTLIARLEPSGPPWGPFWALRGPPITMGPSLFNSPSNFSPLGKISAPSVSRFGRDAQPNKQTNKQTSKLWAILIRYIMQIYVYLFKKEKTVA